MLQHPVPQNVTTFQFKLIGDITLKQFAYVAGGIILAYVIYKLPLLPALIQLPFAIFTAMLGFGLAFIPIEQRPMDRWLIAFAKSIYMPTQYVWKKDNAVPEALTHTPIMQTVPVVQPPQTHPPTPTPKPAPPPPEPVQPVVAAVVPPPLPVTPPPPFKPVAPPVSVDWKLGAPAVTRKTLAPLQPPAAKPITGERILFEKPINQSGETTPSPEATAQVEKLKQQYQKLETELQSKMQVMQAEMQKGTITKERFLELQQLLTQLLADKDRMSKEMADLRKQLSQSQAQAPVKPVVMKNTVDERSSVKIMAPKMARQEGMPSLTTYPNVITGIVKDTYGNLLPNIIVTVKDKEDVPVRALKTNKLGQFAASTQLAKGTYLIELDDPKGVFSFERVELTLSNEVLPPIEISAISAKDIQRQKLAQEIFGTKSI